MSLIETSATELARRVAAGETSAREVALAFCEHARAVEPKVQAFLRFEPDRILASADAIDRRRTQGHPLGPLAGVPVAVKDVLCTKGERTTCGSRILENFVPPYDAGVVERLRRADALLFGRANMDEFAMGSSTENSGYQVTRNPWDVERVPGGSSGGSAAAVAAGMAPLAIGTDTGGSIRQPASFCGIVGLKPTYGRVSRFGLVAFASSLDQIGPMARTAEDAALLLEVIAGHDPRDSTSVDRPTPAYRERLAGAVKGLHIGVVAEHFGEGLDPEVAAATREAIAVLEKAGAKVLDVRLPNAAHAIAAYYLVATAEASSNLARYDGVHFGRRAKAYKDMLDMYAASRGEGFGKEVKRRVMLGTFALSAGYRDAYYTKALRVRRLIKEDFDDAFTKVDVIAGPVTPTAAFRIGEKASDPLAMYLSDIYTVSANLSGLPGMSLPCGFTSAGLPIGLQLQAAPFEEETLLRVGASYQSLTEWHQLRPAIACGKGGAA